MDPQQENPDAVVVTARRPLPGEYIPNEEDDLSQGYKDKVTDRASGRAVADMEEWQKQQDQNVSTPAAQPVIDPATPPQGPEEKPNRRPTDDSLGRLDPAKGSIAGTIMRNIGEIPMQVAGGVHDAIMASMRWADPLADWLNEHVADLRYNVDDTALAHGDTLTGDITRKLSQFMTGFLPAMKGLKAMGMTGKLTTPIVAGGISDFITREGSDSKLADLWNDMGLPKNVLTDFLASDPNDGEMLGRVKNAAEGVIAGVALDGLVKAMGWLRGARKILNSTRDEAAILKDKYGDIPDTAFKIIGDPSKPAVVTVVRKPSAAAGKLNQAVNDVGGLATPKQPPTAEQAVRDILGDEAVHTGPIDDLKTGQYVLSRTWAHDGGSIFMAEGRGEGGAIGLKSMTNASDPEAVAEAAHEAFHAKLHREGLEYESKEAEKQINDLTAEWLSKNLEGDDLNKALKHLDLSDASYGNVGARSMAKATITGGEVDAAITPGQIGLTGYGKVKTGDFETYINFAKINTGDDVKSVMGEMADALKTHVDEARRGTMTQEETQKLADDLGMNVVDLLKRRNGQAFSAEESIAARSLWAASGERLLAAAKAAADPNAGPIDQFAFRKMLAIHSAIQNEVLGARAEAGRALASWNIPVGGTERARAIEQMMQAMGGPGESALMAKRLAILDEFGNITPAMLGKIAQRGWGSISADAIKELFVNGLLSSPKTHAVNVGSNLLVAFQQVYERAAAGAIRGVVGGEGVHPGEAVAMAYGAVESLKDAFRLSAKALRTGETGWSLNKVDLAKPNAISAESFRISQESGLGRAVDFLGNALGIGPRLLGAEDEFFKTIGYRMELRAQALRTAAGEGNVGEALARRTQELVDVPPESLRIASADAALYSTFTNEMGSFGKAMMNLRNIDHPLNPLTFILPFVRTPVNIARYAFERTPFAPLVSQWRSDIAAGGARADLALARMSTGTAIMLVAMDMADKGLVSGEGPRNNDGDVRDAMIRQGWQPYSAKIGDRWYSYNRADPFGMTMGFAASIAESVRKGELDQNDVDEWQEVAAMSIAAVSQVTISKTYLEGFSKFVETVSDPHRYSQQYIDDLFASFLPMTAANNSVKNMVDPVQREVQTPADAVRARIAGLSDSLPPRRNLWGELITSESGLGRVYDAVSPIASRKQVDSPIDREMVRLEAGQQRIEKQTAFDGVKVNLRKFPQVYDQYTQLAGNGLQHPAWNMGAKDYLNAVVTGQHPMSATYNIMSDESRKSFIASTVSEYRKLAQQHILQDPKNRAFAAEVERLKQINQGAKMPVLDGQ